MPTPTDLSVVEAADETGIPRRTLQAAILRGALKARKLPGRTGSYLIQRRDLDRWIAKRDAKASA